MHMCLHAVKVEFLDETPFIQKYNKPGGAYYTNYLAEKVGVFWMRMCGAAAAGSEHGSEA